MDVNKEGAYNVTQEYVEELVEADDVRDNVHDEDDIDNDQFIETNSDGDDDIAASNPYNVESRSDDTNADLDGEDDHEVH